MARKMQMNAPQSNRTNGQNAHRLLLDGAIVLLIALITVWLLMIPVNAADRNPQQMTVMTQGLPLNFKTKSATLGLIVLEIEHLDMLKSQIVQLSLTPEQHPAHALETLADAFPDTEFILVNEADEGFGLAGN